METSRLIDPFFWADKEPFAPGAELPEGVEDPMGLVWFRTSGSTGTPKWRGLSREALLLSAAMVNRHLGVEKGDVWGLVLPIHHVGGFGVVARAFESGCRLARFAGRWDVQAVHTWLEVDEVGHLSLVPTQVHDLMAAGLKAPESLKTVVVGGGAMATELGQRARDLGWPVLASYGMTEAGSQIATGPLESLNQAFSAGPLPLLPMWEAQVSEAGCLAIKGPCLFSASLVFEGSWQFQAREGDVFDTEDRVEFGNGAITPLGRNDRCVKVLGELVDLGVIENALGLKDAVVVAVPDERKGQRLVLVHTDFDVDEALGHYHATVEGPWRIDATYSVAELPRGELGKLRMDELSRMAAIAVPR